MSNPHDKEILSHIFNPLLPLNGDLLQEDVEDDDVKEILDDDENSKRSRDVERQAIREAELGHFTEAIELFSLAIESAPLRSSCFNNRAQTYRLMGKVEGNA